MWRESVAKHLLHQVDDAILFFLVYLLVLPVAMCFL